MLLAALVTTLRLRVPLASSRTALPPLAAESLSTDEPAGLVIDSASKVDRIVPALGTSVRAFGLRFLAWCFFFAWCFFLA